MKSFRLAVVAPAHPLVNLDVKSVMVPGEEGYIGIMAGREAILVNLKLGLTHIFTSDEQHLWLGLTGGFFEMIENQATLLADDLIDSKEAVVPAHYKGKPVFFPLEYSSEVQKKHIICTLLHRKLFDSDD